MNILIIGAAGGIGIELVSSLSLDNTHNLLLGFHNEPTTSEHNSIKIDASNFDEVENYWNNKKSNGIYRPKEILNVRDLINQISKDTGAISVISRAEIDKIPAKIRILYE